MAGDLTPGPFPEGEGEIGGRLFSNSWFPFVVPLPFREGVRG
jgi:hypothetical protein